MILGEAFDVMLEGVEPGWLVVSEMHAPAWP